MAWTSGAEWALAEGLKGLVTSTSLEESEEKTDGRTSG